jgi:hypothetical protein
VILIRTKSNYFSDFRKVHIVTIHSTVMADAAERIIALRSIGWKCKTAAEIGEIALVLGPAELIALYHRLWKGTDAEFCLHAGIQLVSMLRACYLLISTLCVSLVRCVLTHSSSTL